MDAIGPCYGIMILPQKYSPIIICIYIVIIWVLDGIIQRTRCPVHGVEGTYPGPRAETGRSHIYIDISAVGSRYPPVLLVYTGKPLMRPSLRVVAVQTPILAPDGKYL